MSRRSLMLSLLSVQVATFAVLGLLLVARGQYRLGCAQLLLAAVQAIIYSAGLPA